MSGQFDGMRAMISGVSPIQPRPIPSIPDALRIFERHVLNDLCGGGMITYHDGGDAVRLFGAVVRRATGDALPPEVPRTYHCPACKTRETTPPMRTPGGVRDEPAVMLPPGVEFAEYQCRCGYWPTFRKDTGAWEVA